jgi:putative nucleotidyltransferase with HDIG domain
MVRARRKRWFDPALVDIFLDEARRGHLWERLADAEKGHALDRLEPPDRELLATPERLDRVAHAFARVIDAKSPFTFQHSERVAAVATAMSELLGFPATAVRDQMRAGLLHDIGKLAISNRILDKPGPLTEAERRAVEKHPGMTYRVLSRVSPFRAIADVAAAHHERLDGSGYHRGLSGADLSLSMRILAVADVYDALSSARPYRAAMPTEAVLAILRRERERALCPESVEAIIALVSQGMIAAPLAA